MSEYKLQYDYEHGALVTACGKVGRYMLTSQDDGRAIIKTGAGRMDKFNLADVKLHTPEAPTLKENVLESKGGEVDCDGMRKRNLVNYGVASNRAAMAMRFEQNRRY